MGGLLKSLALLFPPLRRLHEERNRYAAKLATLSEEMTSVEAAREQLHLKHDRLQSELTELQLRLAGLTQLVTTATAECRVLRSILVSQAKRAAMTVDQKRLYVVGYARSGTTILMDILNSSNDIFLFSELNLHILRKFPDLFSHYGGDDFIMHFSERKKRELPVRYKSAFPPNFWLSAGQSLPTPDGYIDHLGQKFLYVGDKIATANRMMAGVSDLALLKEFLEQEQEQEQEQEAWFFFTIRRPSENLLSVSRMFPDADLPEWGKSIAETTIAIIESFLRGNRSYLVFHEDIGPSLITELSGLLGVDLSISSNLVGADHQTTRGQSISLEKPWIIALDAAYSELYELYRCDSGSLKHSKTDRLTKKVAVAIERLRAVVEELSKNKDSDG